MCRTVISMGVLLSSACASDAGTTGYPEPQREPATTANTSTTGSTTANEAGGQTSTTAETTTGQNASVSGITSGQGNPSSGNVGGQTSTGSGATGGQTSAVASTVDGQSDPGTGSAGEAATRPLSFAADIWPLWSMVREPPFVYRGMDSYSGCTDVGVCHGGQSPGAGLRMPDQQTAYAQMIDTPSVSSLCAGTQRVVVGDPENSCLVLFYQGRLGSDDLGWVDDAEIELMREWIRQGALP